MNLSPLASIVYISWIERRISEANLDMFLALGKITHSEYDTIKNTAQIPE